jgi:TetR/AcrR family transcriptional regulator, transcriptional repressor for nem operon
MKNDSTTRERLIEVARDLFWRQGYASTGIAEILSAAGAGSGSLYYFFPTKEDLLLAVLEWYKANLWKAVVDPVFERVSDPIERIFGILDGYRQGLVQTRFIQGCPVGNLALELANSHPGARQMIAENFTGWREAIEQCVRAAVGRLPAGADPAQIALFVLTTMEGAVMLARAYHDIEPYDNAVTCLRDYFDRLTSDGTDWARPRSRPATPKSSRARLKHRKRRTR